MTKTLQANIWPVAMDHAPHLPPMPPEGPAVYRLTLWFLVSLATIGAPLVALWLLR